jgi:hypothetical protein
MCSLAFAIFKMKIGISTCHSDKFCQKNKGTSKNFDIPEKNWQAILTTDSK